jgi:hypothetical protein
MEPNYGYKHTRGFIVFLIIIFCGWVIVAHSQVSNTGNLVGSTWTNGYSVPELTCWGDERGSNNCSPGGIPYVRPGGAINFSYSFTELHQVRAMADALPYSGAGLMVTGFQFNWTSKNGNHWDDARQDQLSAYVQMYSKGGQWIENKSYNLNFIHDWTNFAWTGTFSKERRGEDLGTILYGFMGRDNNYWLGPYGPEIMNVSFSLRYQPDPCVTNPLHSTDCPGFLKAIASPAYQAQESSAAITPIVTATISSTTPAMSLPAMTSSIVKLTARQEQVAQETEQAGTSSLGMANKNANSLAEISLPTMSTAAARLNSRQEQFAVETETAGTSTGTANKNANSQNEIGLPTVSTASVKSNSRQEQSSQETDQTVVTSGPGLSSFMSLGTQATAPITVARVRTGSSDSTDSAVTRDSAIEQTVVTQTATTGTLAQNISNQTRSNQARDTSTRSDTASETVTLDQSLIAMPQTTSTTTVVTVSTLPVQPRSTTSIVTTDNDTAASTQISLFRAPEPIVISQPDTQTNYSMVEPARINTDPQPVNIPVQVLAAPSQPAPVQETASVAEPVRAPTVEIPAVDGQSSTVAAALIDRTNPLNDAVNGQQLPTQTAVFAGPAVKPNTQDNDIAGGVTISQIARVPAGFDVYQNLAIREIAFYQPREIYRGQRTVDNVRALRSLGQDAKHQEMVDQQYRR